MKQPSNVPGEIRFGNIAMSKGFITGEQLVNAINIQIKTEVESREHKLLGEILVDEGFMKESQVKKVLKIMKKSG